MTETSETPPKGKRRGRAKEAEIPAEVMDRLIAELGGQEALGSPQELLRKLTAAIVNRALEAEMDHHLGYSAGETPPAEQSNRRNGRSTKRLRTDQGEVEVQVPRDREASFEPQLVPKHQRQFAGFDDKILALYARGMTVRDIQAHLAELYGVDVSPDLISRVTDGVMDELRAWQQRPLESVYCVVYLDAIVVKIRSKNVVENRAIYLAVGIPQDGERQVLGMWVQQTEGAKFWCSILQELRQRGVHDILVICADGLTGMNQAAEAVFPGAIFQTCIVHVIRASTRFVPWKERKAVCADLRGIYTATDSESAERALEEVEAKWDAKFPSVARSWRARWEDIIPFLAFPPEIRRAIYTTNAIEALNRNLRKALKTRGHLPSDDAAFKLLYLALRHDRKGTVRRSHDWTRALNQFAIFFDGRITI